MAGLSVGVQLVSRRESPPRALGMERQELLTKSEVFEDEILAGTQRTDSPSKEVPEQHDHGKNLTEICIVRLTAKSLILRVRNVLTRHSYSCALGQTQN